MGGKFYALSILIWIGVFAGILIMGYGAQFILGPDNEIEEAVEDYLEDKTGIETDLSED